MSNTKRSSLIQFAFVATGATIVSGALAERCRFVAYFGYCAAMAAFAYPTITHWAWHPNGWLATMGFRVSDWKEDLRSCKKQSLWKAFASIFNFDSCILVSEDA